MAQTTLSDVFVPEVFGSYVNNNSPEKSAFVASGAVVANSMLDMYAAGPGFITTLPFWNDLDSSVEPNYSNDVFTDVAQPQKITAGEQVARNADLNEGFSSMDLVAAIAGSDPNKRIAERVDAYWMKQFQRRSLAVAIGVYNDNVAANGKDMVVDITSQIAGTITDNNRFSSAAFIDASFTLGDSFDSLAAIALHSMVARKMVVNNEIEFVPDSDGKLTIPTYKGKRVIIDDGMPSFGTGVDRKYLSILFGQGAIGYGKASAKVPEEMEREAARGNGGGVETLWTRRRWMIHPFGYKFLSQTITGPGLSPTWADLALASNWERVLDRKQVPMAFLLTNG